MSKKHLTYNRRLAQATQAAFVEDGENFVEPDDIHKKMYGHKCPSQAVRKDIRRRLATVRNLLNRDYGMVVFLVTEPSELPKTMMEARALIPGRGPHKPAGAIGRVNGPATQMIYLAEKETWLAAGAGKMRANIEDIIEACARERVAAGKGQAVIMRAQKSLTPKQLSGAGKKLANKTHLLGND